MSACLPAQANAPLGEGEVAIDVDGANGGTNKGLLGVLAGFFSKKGTKATREGEMVVRAPPLGLGPPPGASPRASGVGGPEPTGALEHGWRRVEDDDGDVYYYKEETGESRWEAPLKSGGRSSIVAIGQVQAPPMPPPPQLGYDGVQFKESSLDMMAE